MKIKPEHFDHLKQAIDAVIAVHPVAEYRKAHPNFSEERIRWDYLYASKLSQTHTTGNWINYNLYPYLNDEHIDTALRAIVK